MLPLRLMVVALLLFASVGTASAECAWVLWEQLQGPAGHSELVKVLTTRPITGYASKSECLAGATAVVQGSTLTVINPLTVGLPRGQSMTYLCLPDTVDPRGPKGK